MNTSILFDPLLPLPILAVAGAVALLLILFAIWRGLPGWWLRGAALAALLAAIANPSVQTENRDPLSDIVFLVVDESASQKIGDRPEQSARARAFLEAEVAALPNTELRVVIVEDGEGDSGTLLMGALAEAMAEAPRNRIAGAILLSDGRLHDIDGTPDLPAPLHAVLTGHDTDWDRRLVVKNAPAFAILGEEASMTIMVEDQGRVPADLDATAQLQISIDGSEMLTFTIPVGQELDLPIRLDHAGINVIQLSVPAGDTELTDRNNGAVVQINGVRDRLRVLLVSGEPHAGTRTWRNLLKSDASVDLVHFTILRPPEKQDGVPVDELSLIAFPTRELFLDKIDEFDLIIFDRYKRRGILSSVYFESVRSYVENGGAILVAAGPDFASAESIYRSPLASVLPARPSGRVIEQGFAPTLTELGHRHPVTEGLEQFALSTVEDDDPLWGRWMRLIDVESMAGHTVMTGFEDRPLLVLDRVGEGRVALLASDHAWLWSRGFEGGGPQLELLRRLAHWMMKEPELEEEALTATAQGQTMTITRRTLEEEIGPVELTLPDGSTVTLELEETTPGRFTTTFEGPEIGLYRLREGDMETVVALGPAAPREFEQTIATGDILDPAVKVMRGGLQPIENGLPDLRQIREGRPAAGRGWLGILPRGAYVTTDVTVTPILPAWLFLLIAALLAVAAWLFEGRRKAA